MNIAIPIVLIFTALALLEVPSLLKQKLFKELIMFAGLLVFALTIGIMQGLRVEIPNPFKLLTFIFKPMTKIIQGLLK